jgi:hypothetical protein
MKRLKGGASYKSLGTSGVACWKFYEASIEQSIFETRKPNVVVEWLTLLLRIREVMGSNFVPETGYPD